MACSIHLESWWTMGAAIKGTPTVALNNCLACCFFPSTFPFKHLLDLRPCVIAVCRCDPVSYLTNWVYIGVWPIIAKMMSLWLLKGHCFVIALRLQICLVSLWSVISDNQELRLLPRGRNASWDKQMLFQISLNWGSTVIGCHCFPNVFVVLAVHVWLVYTFRKHSVPTKH